MRVALANGLRREMALEDLHLPSDHQQIHQTCVCQCDLAVAVAFWVKRAVPRTFPADLA